MTEEFVIECVKQRAELDARIKEVAIAVNILRQIVGAMKQLK